MEEKAAGILLHLTSLPNRYPIGDVGPAAMKFVDFLKASGQRFWQMLPVEPVGLDNSPYQCTSAFAGNPLLISPDSLVTQGLLSKKRLAQERFPEDKVDFRAAREMKHRLLREAFKTLERKADPAQEKAFHEFVEEAAYWLDDFALFYAIAKKMGTRDWTTWDKALRVRKIQALVQAKKTFAGDIRFLQFQQWQFALQWEALKRYCLDQGICLIGDISLFMAHGSPDVWAHPEIFKLNKRGHPTVVAGVRPDYFSSTGQRWGLPVYRWNVLKTNDYHWWLLRLKASLRRFNLLRLDHFIGFVRTYEIPARNKTALIGHYRPGGGDAFFKAVHRALGGFPFIAEDLGVVTPSVENLRRKLRIPGTKVLQFEIQNYLEEDERIIIPQNSVIYTGTHDNDTALGWYKHLPSEERHLVKTLLHAEPETFHWAMIERAFQSRAKWAIMPMQDYLGLGTKGRMNKPGTGRGNWRWRLKRGVLSKTLARRIKRLTKDSERV